MNEQAQIHSDNSWRQFNLRILKTGVICVGVMLVLKAVPLAVAALYVELTGILAIAIWKGRGWIRAFAVGALFPNLVGYLLLLEARYPSDLFGMALAIVAVSCASGIAAAAFHGALVRSNGVLPIPNLPYLRDWFTND